MVKEIGRDYPFIDETGNIWLDAYGVKAANEGSCIVCSRQTTRFDINFLSFFCNTPACNMDSRTLLIRNGYNGEYDEEHYESGGTVR